MVSGQELRDLLADHYGELKPAHREDPNQPATDYEFIDGRGMVGFIDSVSQPFCSDCNRLRLTADGHLKNCLFGREDWNVGELLRANASADEILQMIRAGVWAKHASHGISEEGFQPPPLAMYQIGG
jgi:cyclic pyranopterin phosphate synthase